MSGGGGMRLSKLQKHIISVIAKHIINSLDCPRCWIHGWKEESISNKSLFGKCYDFWPDDSNIHHQDMHGAAIKPRLSRRASFSRALHNLVEKKHLLGAYALAWINIEANFEPIRIRWQGGGRPERNDGYLDDTPRYSLLYLTGTGWEAARKLLGPEIGKCVHCK